MFYFQVAWAGFYLTIDDKKWWMDLFMICFDDTNSGPTVEILISLDSEKTFDSFSREIFSICI